MKYLVVLSAAFIVASCGKVAVNGSSSLGSSLKYDPSSIAPSSELQAICQAISSKTPALSISGEMYAFDHYQKSCYEPSLSASQQPTPILESLYATIARSGSTYYFQRSTNQMFYDVETSTTGVMGLICSSLTDLKDQLMTADNQVLTFSTSVNTADCSASFGQKCIRISYFSRDASTDTYVNHTTEYLKFNANTQVARNGFWVERKRVSSGSCGGRLISEQRAVLK